MSQGDGHAMTAADIIDALDSTQDRAELVALLAPLRVPTNVDDFDRGQLATALVRAVGRCWRKVSA